MNVEKLSHWVQILSGIALVAGIFLVLEEMNQTKQLARTQLAADSSALGLSRHLTFLGEDPMSTMAKACDNGSRLSKKDALVLSNIFKAYLATVGRAYRVSALGGFDDEQWKEVAMYNIPSVFSTQHGRDWWRHVTHTKKWLNTPIREFGDKLLAGLGPPNCDLMEVILETDQRVKSSGT
jgi:hypothetical protein